MSGYTPGKLEIRPSRDGSGDVGIVAPGVPNVIAECFAAIRHSGERSPEAEANAARIVMTWNAHDELVAALADALRMLEAAHRHGGFDHAGNKRVIACRAALSKVQS